ncbi:MAG: N-6 DNA methylase [Aeriscardovia sp.]|nr:N-6 DNA methylase [Aeriscardovia sp.]
MTDFDRRFAPDRRRKHGIFYTSSDNIRKCIAPLLENVTKENASRCTFFDPACGNGNFLVETKKYLEEKGIHTEERQSAGIEIEPTAVEEAKRRMPGARIVCGNALEMDWSDLVTPSPDLFVFGNPPYIGFEYQTPSQKKELDLIFGEKRCGTFDYCTAWTFKAAKFLNGSGAHFAFVTTSSIVQGTQATPLLKPIFDMGWKISFAYPAFMWDLQGAAVAVVIIGMAQNSKPPYRLWDNEEEDFIEVENISQYLTDLPTLFVTNSKNPNMPKILNGSIASDGGGLILEDLAAKEEAEKDPEIAKYIRPFKGARNLIHDTERWCLWLKDSTPHERQSSEFWQKRAPIVKEAREGTDKADKPLWLFANDRQPSMTYLAIPRTVSEKRPYVLADFLPVEVIADNDLFTCTEEPELAFAIVESLMFMAWQDLIGGAS